MPDLAELRIQGYGGEPVPNTFLQQAGEAHHVGILLPGMGYTAQAPLLWYAARLLEARGADILLVEYAYNRRPEAGALSRDEQMRRLYADAAAACSEVLRQRPYREITLVGKSLGTLAMSHLLAHEAALHDARAIWLTPLLRIESHLEEICRWGGRSLFVIGTADPHFDPALLRRATDATSGEVVIVERADHGMSIENDPLGSIEALERIVRAEGDFLGAR